MKTKFFSIIAAAAFAIGLAGPASAIPFDGTIDPTANTSFTAGVALSTTEIAILDFDLAAVGQSITLDLFDINLLEPVIPIIFGFGNDPNVLDIFVEFTFTAPSSSSGTVTGTTRGVITPGFFDPNDLEVDFDDNPVSIAFGGIVIEVLLADLTIPGGLIPTSLFPLQFGSGTVEGTFTLAAVPVPAALPLFGTALAIMGFVGWRRKQKAAIS